MKFFGTVGQQSSDGKSCYSPLFYPNFSVRGNSETLKVSLTKFFGAVRQKIFDGKT